METNVNTLDITPKASMTPQATFAGLSVPCCFGGPDESCICGVDSDERALRGYDRGAELPAMTATQREFCLSEIGRVEGYDRADYEGSTDKQLANAVLCAWMDHARDKGMA